MLRLAADAVQSATCAYLALITLTGLTANAVFHIPWVDSLAALVAVPILLMKGGRPGRVTFAVAAEPRSSEQKKPRIRKVIAKP